LSWLFFRARDLTQAIAMLADLRSLEWRPGFLPILVYLGVIAAITFAIDLRLEFWKEEYPFEKARTGFALAAAAVFGAVMVVFGPMESNAFIYFQF
jgi:hypothetical protein